MIIKKLIPIIAFTVISIVGCSKKNTIPVTPVVPPPNPVQPVTPITTLPAGWRLATTFMANFPTSIQVFSFDSIYSGKKIKAFCVAYDSRNINIECKPTLSTTAKTPTAFVASETGITYACINAGYFGSGQSFSLVKYNGTTSSPNIRVLNRPFNGTSTAYYPTRAAFGFSSTGTPSVAWVYNLAGSNDVVYSYPAPSPNMLNSAPQAQPTATFPSGGTEWNVTTAIGGSPVLIKNNTIQITDAQELIDINNTSSRPRSAIGYLTNGIVLIFAVEGDNAPDYVGVNLAELASFVKTFNCAEAINLDGGGSTSMVVNGTLTVRPGDAGVERPVMSALLIKRK